jgi:histidine triad (HIT) family protein
MRILSKSEAFELLAVHRRELLGAAERCVMCALATRTSAKHVIHEDRVCRVVLDALGNRPGHLLVIPKRHAESFTSLSLAEYQSLQTSVFYAARAVEATLRPRRVFVASTGASDELPMSFPHFHVHVIPVYESDERARPASVLSWSEGVVAYEEREADELSHALAARWNYGGENAHEASALCNGA